VIDPNLKNIDKMKAVDDSKAESLTNLDIGIGYRDSVLFSDYNDAVKNRRVSYLKEHWDWYIEGVKRSFIANNHIPFNAILMLAIELFKEYPSVLRFYQKLFPDIIVDEFQDTNILSWALIKTLHRDDTRIMFMGDPLQRIYGFIGALPGLMDHAHDRFEMEKYHLDTNYRFKDNSYLLLIDRNIRENARDPRSPDIDESCDLKVLQGENQPEEAQIICDLVREILEDNGLGKVAILTKQRGPNINAIMDAFGKAGLQYFYALFSDDAPEYIKFHHDAMRHFIKILESKSGSFNKNTGNRLYSSLKKAYDPKDKEIYRSLLRLLEVFLQVVFKEYSFLDIDDKIDFIRDTIDSRSLKQYLEYIDSNIIVSTVHGAKGLEWDFVVVPDMEQYLFPNWFGLCGECKFKFESNCMLDWTRIKKNGSFERQFYEELSVFYVAATRARKDLYFTLSDMRYKNNGIEMPSLPSCLLSLEGFNIA